jgi:hypothetical protein
MLPPNADLEGCEVLFPDSVFFGDDGYALFIARSLDLKLNSTTYNNKLKDL